jgi:hypothetical protein
MDLASLGPAGNARSGDGEPCLYQSRRRKPTRSAGQCGDSPSWDLRRFIVEMQQSCRPQNDGRTKKARGAHEKGAQTGDNAIGWAKVGRTLASAIEDQELMFDEHRFSNHGTGASRHCQSEHGDDQMTE